MIRLPASIPWVALDDLSNVLLGEAAVGAEDVVLLVRLNHRDIGVRDLSTFLQFIDGLYGRLSEHGLQSYAQNRYKHLRISEVRPGSWELVFIEALASPQSAILALTFLVLKLLPSSLKTIAGAYNEFEQGRLARQERKRIRDEIQGVEYLSELSPRRRQQVAALIEELYELEKLRMPRTKHFVQTHLLDLELQFRSPDGTDHGTRK